MMNGRMDWHGGEAERRVLNASWEGLVRAVLYYHARLQDALNVSAKVGRGTKASDYQASRPGEPPRKRTGWLQRNVVYELDRMSLRARVGVTKNALYGVFLELGSIRIAARPWLLSTLRKCWTQIAELAGKAA